MHVCIHIYICVYIHEHMIYTYAHYMYVHICRLHIYMCTRIYMCARKKVFRQKGIQEEATEKQVFYLKISYRNFYILPQNFHLEFLCGKFPVSALEHMSEKFRFGNVFLDFVPVDCDVSVFFE